MVSVPVASPQLRFVGLKVATERFVKVALVPVTLIAAKFVPEAVLKKKFVAVAFVRVLLVRVASVADKRLTNQVVAVPFVRVAFVPRIFVPVRFVMVEDVSKAVPLRIVALLVERLRAVRFVLDTVVANRLVEVVFVPVAFV